jgi:hypothetical protein
MELYIFVGIFIIWLGILTFLVLKTRMHYQKLIAATKKGTLEQILEQVIQNDEHLVKENATIQQELKNILDYQKLNLQKIGLVRFNPFERTGGEQSFVIAFLDSYNTGIVVNYIYMRDGMHVYAKKVKRGKGEKYELSHEEIKAIEKSA